MDWSVAGFDWDEGNEEKCLKHGASIDEIERLFRSMIMVLPDQSHSTNIEDRQLAIGRTRAERFILVAFTLRERDEETLIRRKPLRLNRTDSSNSIGATIR